MNEPLLKSCHFESLFFASKLHPNWQPLFSSQGCEATNGALVLSDCGIPRCKMKVKTLLAWNLRIKVWTPYRSNLLPISFITTGHNYSLQFNGTNTALCRHSVRAISSGCASCALHNSKCIMCSVVYVNSVSWSYAELHNLHNQTWLPYACGGPM